MLKYYFFNTISPFFISVYAFLVLATAFIFEYGFGYLPCELCWYQRYAWFGVLIFSLISGFFGHKNKPKQQSNENYIIFFLVLSIIFLIVGLVLAGFHTGVEQKFWTGLASCTSSSSIAQTGVDLLNMLKTTTAPSCDKPTWTLFGISMASFNFLLSLNCLVCSFIIIKNRLQK